MASKRTTTSSTTLGSSWHILLESSTMTMDSDSDVCMIESDYDEDDAFASEDDVENVKPISKKTKASTKVKKTVLAPNSNASNVPIASAQGAKREKTVEEIYQKKTQLEHILLRPDTYIGSVERLTTCMYVLSNDKIVERDITYTPGLFKIFDEIVVNAADNKQRDQSMDRLDIEIDPESNVISVRNNGQGIPVVVHGEHGCYVPTLIFGHLLTGSNFDDDEKKTTGGRNGYGAKLANVFSTQFIVECIDTEHELKFRQVFSSNMSEAHEPVVAAITAAEKKKGDYVKITFSPDLARFGMTHLDSDIVSLMSKRAYDIAGSMASRPGKKLTVTLNGSKVPVKSFKEYLAMFDGIDPPVAYETNDRWEVGVSASTDSSMHQVSFVNAICTSKGGGHVNCIADQIAAHLVKVIKKKNKGGSEVKPAQIKNHLNIFVNCLIENPAFDSQTKEFMTTRSKSFGSTMSLSDKFLKQVDKSNIVETILSYVNFKQKQALKRQGGTKKTKITGITKLDDANFAGTAKSKDCTLIITEGDSAKSLAMSGLSVVGRDYYGVFPLRGKPLNVRDASTSAVIKNEEIKNLVEILGLKFGTQYDENNIKTLRYGHLMIMADQDMDGSHIKGLVINFIHHFWPTLLDVPGFLQQFITPIVKVTKGTKSRSFFNLPEYEQWLESTGNGGKGYTIKYYKGLGTSTSAEGKEYFSNLDLHEVHFDRLSIDKKDVPCDDALNDVLPDMATSGSDLIDMVFRKTRVEDRKEWLNSMAKDTFLDYSKARRNGVLFSEFINKEYILFSNYDNERSIPHLMDGFKPSQRKVLFGCLKRKLKGEVKVAQLCGYIAEHSAYHHGEASLQSTIINMAQNFCGSNNVNLLTPSGQFGTRRLGGKDAASARYIFTKLEPITRAIFHPDDDSLLNYLTDDGTQIEPVCYVPVIPMVLVNGAEGIGTGWSTNVCNYNPRDIIANLRRMIAGEPPVEMLPFYYGFEGKIVPKGNGSFHVEGKIERLDDTTLAITELPLKKWTQEYKSFLEEMLSSDAKKHPEIKDFKENHTETTVSFTITADKEKIDEFESAKNGLMGKFKLSSSLSTSNMNLFDDSGRIIKYENPESILTAFFHIRHEFYIKRKAALVKKVEEEQRILANRARFVEEVCSGELVVSNRKRDDILAELYQKGFDMNNIDEKVGELEEEESTDEDHSDSASTAALVKGYNYLLSMKIWSLTYEKAEQLREQLAVKTKELDVLKATPPTQLWLNDLDAIEVALDERDELIKEAIAGEKRAQKKNQDRRARVAKKAATKKVNKRKDEWDPDHESSDDEVSPESASENEFQIVALKEKKRLPATKKSSPVTVQKVSSAVQAMSIDKKSDADTAISNQQRPSSERREVLSDSDDDMIELSLAQRMEKKQLAVSTPNEVAKLGVSTLSDVKDIITSDFSMEHGSSLRKKTGVRKMKTTKKAGTEMKSKTTRQTVTAKRPPAMKTKSSEDKDSDVLLVEPKSKTGPSKVKPKISKKAKKLHVSSDSSDVSVTDPKDDTQKIAVLSRGRSARAKKPVKYDFSDEGSESEFSFGDD